MDYKGIVTGIIIAGIVGLVGIVLDGQKRITELEAKSLYDNPLKKEISNINQIIISRESILETNKNIQNNNKNVQLRTASGKTKLTALECANKAKRAFEKLNFKNINIEVSKINWTQTPVSTQNSARSVRAFNNISVYSVFCKPFNSDLVFFSAAGNTQENILDIWNEFYNIK